MLRRLSRVEMKFRPSERKRSERRELVEAFRMVTWVVGAGEEHQGGEHKDGED